MKDEKEYASPVYAVRAVPLEKIEANAYNPTLSPRRNGTSRIVDLGGWLYHALRMLLPS
jgi:hypothetical protein